MISLKKTPLPFLACLVLLFVGCKAAINLNSTVLPSAQRSTGATGAFSKILFVEDMGRESAYKFYNNVRRDLRRECAAHKIQCEFVRTTTLMLEPEKRVADAMARFQPEAIVRVGDCESRDFVWLDRGWGPFHDDLHEITLERSLRPAGSDSVLWVADLFVDLVLGVDVASEKVARQLIEQLAADGMVKN